MSNIRPRSENEKITRLIVEIFFNYYLCSFEIAIINVTITINFIDDIKRK